MNDIDKYIYATVRDLIASDGKQDIVAVNCEPERRLLALLVAYQLGEELTNKVLGDENHV